MSTSRNLSQPHSFSYQRLGLGGQGTSRTDLQPEESPPFISLSTDGLAAGSIRIEGFDKTDFLDGSARFYKGTKLLEYLDKILAGSQIDLSRLTEEELAEVICELSPAEQIDLNNFDNAEGGLPQNQPAGIKLPGLSELPVFLKSLYQALNNPNDAANVYYYPLAPGQYWYRGSKGLDFAADSATASETLLRDRKNNTNICLFRLSEDAAGNFPLRLEDDPSWPRPLTKEILQTFPGLRPYANVLKVTTESSPNRNFINPEKLSRWAQDYSSGSGWAALSNDGTPCHKNIMGSTDTLILKGKSDGSSNKLSVTQITGAGDSVVLPIGRTYTISFYARILGPVSQLPSFSKNEPYSDPAALSAISKLVSISPDDSYAPVQYVTASELNSSNGSPVSVLKEKEALFYSWKRYYFTFTKESHSIDLALDIHAPNMIIETGGWLLEEASHPSPYDFRSLDCRKNYDSQTQRTQEPGQSLMYPLIYLLPTQAGSLNPLYQKGTFIYRQYLEDKIFSGKHLCSLGITNGKYVTWGLKGTTAGIWYDNANTPLSSVEVPIDGLVAQKETWLTNVVTFSLASDNKFSVTWTLFSKEPGVPLINLAGEISNIGQSTFGYCSTSSQHIENALLKWSYAHFNLALGCELRAGADPENTDPFNQYFGEEETGLYDFSGDIFSDFVFLPLVLSSDQTRRLTTESLVLKDQIYSARTAEDQEYSETVMTLFAGSIEQGHVQLSKITQAYVDNLSS